MKSLYRQVQRSMCYCEQAQIEKQKKFKSFKKNNKELNKLIEKKLKKIVKNKQMKKPRKNCSIFHEMQLSDDRRKKGVSSVAENIESGEILSSSPKWNLGLDELCIKCLNCDSRIN